MRRRGNMDWWFLAIPIALILYIVVQVAIEKSKLTELLKENNKILLEIKDLLKNQNENT
jgi:hypothetical protein